MDVEKWKAAVRKAFPKDRGVKLLVILGICGIALIYLSTLFGNEKKQESAPVKEEASDSAGEYEQRLERELARIVRAITGEEDPVVLVTLESSSRTVYAADEKTNSHQEENGQSGEEYEKTHVILKDSGGAQQALTVTEIQPKVKGVVIVSRYAGNPVAREKLTEAAKTALDISSAKVCVTDTG